MCRSINNGGRRCPYHSDPRIKALTSARQSLQRMEARLAADEHRLSEPQLAQRVSRLNNAYSRLSERQQAAHAVQHHDRHPEPGERGPLPAPRPTAAPTITAEWVNNTSWDELANYAATLNDDPEAWDKLEGLINEREERENSFNAWATGETPTVEDQTVNPAARTTRKLTPHERAREEYDHYVNAQYMNCLSELSFLVNEKGKRAGVDEFSLFSGPVSRVKKYGSEELQSWFARNGRHTLSSFRHGLFGWNSDAKAAKRVEMEGFEHVAHV